MREIVYEICNNVPNENKIKKVRVTKNVRVSTQQVLKGYLA